MSSSQVSGRTVPSVAANTSLMAPWATRDGAQVGLTSLEAMVAAGYGFHATVGAFSTPIVGGGAGTVLDLDQPEFLLSVPSGTAIKIIRAHIQLQTPLLATDADESEAILVVDRTAAWAADGTSTAETLFNMRTDNPVSSTCTAASAFTADMTSTLAADPVLGIELARSVITGDVNGTPGFAALLTKHELLYEPKVPLIVVGPAMVLGYWGGTVATSGYGQIQFIEYPAAFAGLISST